MPVRHHPNPIDNRHVKYMASDRGREGHHNYTDYNRRVNPKIVFLGEIRSPGRHIQEDAHDPRLHYLPRQAERILPSVEDSFRNINYQKDFSNDINEGTHKFDQPDISTHRGIQRPRIINLGNKTEVHANESHRLHDRVTVPPDNFWQSRGSHEESARRASRKPSNEGVVSYLKQAPLLHQSVSDLSAGVKGSTLLRPLDAGDYSDRLMSGQIAPHPIDGVSQIPQRGFDRQVHPAYDVPSGLVRQRRVLLNSANGAVEKYQPLPISYYPQKQLPLLHGYSRSQGTSHQDGGELRYETVKPLRVDDFRSSALRAGGDSPGMQYRFADMSIAPEYDRHHAGAHRGAFDRSGNAYPSPRIDGSGLHAPRTGILLRNIVNDRHSKPDGVMPRLSQTVLHLTHEDSTRSQFHKPGAIHEISNVRQDRFPAADKFERDNTRW